MGDPEAQTSAPKVHAVLFDYGKVLSNDADPVAWSNILEVAGIEPNRLHDAYWAFRHDYDRGILSGRAYWHAVAQLASTSFTDEQMERLLKLDVDLWTNMNQPMVAFAQALQRTGVRTGILSNIGDAIAEGILARLPWLADFDHCTWSYRLRTAKPDPMIYQRTAECLSTPPEAILFLDDREDNIAAAATLGFQTIRYTSHPEFLREMQERGYGHLLEIAAASQPLEPV